MKKHELATLRALLSKAIDYVKSEEEYLETFNVVDEDGETDYTFGDDLSNLEAFREMVEEGLAGTLLLEDWANFRRKYEVDFDLHGFDHRGWKERK